MARKGDKNGGLDPILHNHGQGYIPLTLTMFKSKAWRSLNGRQKDLWFLAETQYIKARKREERKRHTYSHTLSNVPNRYPCDRWEYLTEVVQKPCFYLNEALACSEKGENLYKTGNRKTFFSDRKVLVKSGFLKEIPVTNQNGEHVMNVYTLSDEWYKSERKQKISLRYGESPTC